MTFQAYLDAVKAKTGLDPEGILALAKQRGVYAPDMKATELINLLKDEFDLGRGHSMSIWAVFTAKGWVKG
ncbi:MAG: DUF4287 domain-containing protein [Rhizobiaceae bacterium]